MYSLYSPDLSPKYDTNRPSGDHAGARSALPLALVRLRASPFSAGIVNTSPRASTATRRPAGEIASAVTRLVTSFHCGIIQGKSPAAEIGTTRVRPVAASSSCTAPPCSNTTAPAPASSVFTSKSRKRVTCRSAFPRVSYAQTFDTPSRSERKYTASPTHTGSMSFESVHGGVTRSCDARSTIQIGRFCPPR